MLFSTSRKAQDMLIARAQTNFADRYYGQETSSEKGLSVTNGFG